jgi:hypothetical protein
MVLQKCSPPEIDPEKEGIAVKKNVFVRTALALAIAAPLMAHAESELVIGAGSAAAELDLRVVIPRVLFLGVGTGAATLATNTTVDALTFDFSTNPLDVGTGAAAGAITSTSPSGTASIPVRVFGNDGQVTITATDTGVLTSTTIATDTIPFSELTVASSSTDLAAPAFGGGTSLPTLTGRITNQTANWTYSYANTTTPAFGTYEGRVTYTATMP